MNDQTGAGAGGTVIDTPTRAMKPDAQAFDEVRIVTVPRYKMSGLSGDEWRISAEIQFYRNGELKHSESYGSVRAACGFAFAAHAEACDNALGYFAGEGEFCDQEGCANKATHRLALKTVYCDSCAVPARHQSQQYRQFCDEHKRRGDCGIDDADRNYEDAEAIA